MVANEWIILNIWNKWSKQTEFYKKIYDRYLPLQHDAFKFHPGRIRSISQHAQGHDELSGMVRARVFSAQFKEKSVVRGVLNNIPDLIKVVLSGKVAKHFKA